MKLQDYMMTPGDVELDEVDLEGLSDFEKETILKVLQRNNRVKFREERRLQQLAVRIQLERMTDDRSRRDESKIKTKTGEWHRDMVRQRCRGKPVDFPSTLYRRISIDLINVDSRKFSLNSRSSSPSPSSSRPSMISSSSRMSSRESPSDVEMSEHWADSDDDAKSSFFKKSNDFTLVKQNNNNLEKPLLENVKRLETTQGRI